MNAWIKWIRRLLILTVFSACQPTTDNFRQEIALDHAQMLSDHKKMRTDQQTAEAAYHYHQMVCTQMPQKSLELHTTLARIEAEHKAIMQKHRLMMQKHQTLVNQHLILEDISDQGGSSRDELEKEANILWQEHKLFIARHDQLIDSQSHLSAVLETLSVQAEAISDGNSQHHLSAVHP